MRKIETQESLLKSIITNNKLATDQMSAIKTLLGISIYCHLASFILMVILISSIILDAKSIEQATKGPFYIACGISFILSISIAVKSITSKKQIIQN